MDNDNEQYLNLSKASSYLGFSRNILNVLTIRKILKHYNFANIYKGKNVYKLSDLKKYREKLRLEKSGTYLNASNAAKVLDLNSAVLKDLTEKGLIKSFEGASGNRSLYSADEIVKFMKGRKVEVKFVVE